MAFSLFPQRFAAALIGAFGVIGLVLAGIGVHGVLAFEVARRTREFGVRTALGAGVGGVLRLVLGRGALLAGAGALVGLGLAAAAGRLLEAFLFGIRPLDPVSFVVVPAVLGVVALVASALPAWRAARVAPMEALRQE
jgi:ABC-type antimicrobial peptide transport system permease subunit